MTLYHLQVWVGDNLMEDRSGCTWLSAMCRFGQLEDEATYAILTRQNDNVVVMRFSVNGLKR